MWLYIQIFQCTELLVLSFKEDLKAWWALADHLLIGLR